jgi:hypothetical protein
MPATDAYYTWRYDGGEDYSFEETPERIAILNRYKELIKKEEDSEARYVDDPSEFNKE